MSATLLLVAIALVSASGVPGLCLPPRSRSGPALAFLCTGAASLLGGAAAVLALEGRGGDSLHLPWSLPGAELAIRVDPLAGIFLLPIFLISWLSSGYGLSSPSQGEHPEYGRRLRFFFGLLVGGMALLVGAENGIAFLMGWEAMALSAFFLIATEERRPEVREASFIYLAATHLGSLALFAFFAVLFATTGGLTLAPLAPGVLSPATADALFILALFGFGLKAGLFPLQFWLPAAHAQSPSHISAILSGVMIKMGVYGVVRFCALIPDPPLWWGALLISLGCLSGVLGVAFALGQHDLKRLLAYHSIENIGIIFIGLGLALIGRSTGQIEWVVLGLGGALLHVWNHGLFKALLFLAAGSVVRATHTREIDQLGGLARRMPITALGFLIGAVAICGLPPLNGFVSELAVFLGLFEAGTASGWESAAPLIAIPALGFIGGLALLCFVKVFGVVFLGEPRHSCAAAAVESPRSSLVPLLVLGAACLWIGVLPGTITPWFDAAVENWLPRAAGSGLGTVTTEIPAIASLLPVGAITATGISLLVAFATGAIFLARRRSIAIATPAPSRAGDRVHEPLVTWGCGYAAPSARMQYTASSFAAEIVRFLRGVLLPRTTMEPVTGMFPTRAAHQSEVVDVVLDRTIIPGLRGVAWLFSWFRLLQRGRIHAYLLYIFLTLLLLLVLN